MPRLYTLVYTNRLNLREHYLKLSENIEEKISPQKSTSPLDSFSYLCYAVCIH